MVEWTDELWEQIWERLLDQIERHSIAMDVWARRLPHDPLHRAIAPELARRWRRTARNFILLYGTWSLFWGLIAAAVLDTGGIARSLSLSMVTVGAAAILICLLVRRRVAPLARLQL